MKSRFTFYCCFLLAFWLSIISANAQQTMSFTGLTSNGLGAAAWNADGTGLENMNYGHALPESICFIDTAYYYFASREYVDGGAPYGMNAAGAFTGFNNTQSVLNTYSINADQIRITFGVMNLGGDVEGTDWTLNQTTGIETREYKGGTYDIWLGNEKILTGNMPNLDLEIQYNVGANPADDEISGITGYSLPTKISDTLSNQANELANAFLADMGNSAGMRFVFTSIQPAFQEDSIDQGRIIGYFDIQNGYLETDDIQCDLSLTPYSNNVSCNGLGDGVAYIDVNDGTAPFTYDWTTATGQPMQNHTTPYNIDTLQNLAAGTYYVNVTDDAGCTASEQITITEPTKINITHNKGDVTYQGGSDGFIDISVSGGTTPYSYSWNTGQSVQNISGLSAGTYTVTVYDQNNCTAEHTIDILENTGDSTCNISLDFYTPYANGQSCNQFQFNANVNNNNNPFTLEWNMGNGITLADTNDFTYDYTSAGTYHVCVTAFDANLQGCDTTACYDVIVNEFNDVEFTYIVNESTVDFTGSYSAYDNDNTNIEWDFGDGNYQYNANSNTDHIYSSVGEYAVCFRVSDKISSNCIEEFCDTIQITSVSACQLNVEFSNPYAEGCTEYMFSHNITNDGKPYEFYWELGDGTTYQDSANFNYTYANSGTYQVCLHASDSADPSCSNTYCKDVVVADPISGTFNTTVNGLTVSVQPDFYGASGSFSYDWNMGDNSSYYETNVTHTYSNSGTYPICVYVHDVDNYHCMYHYCDSVYVTEQQPCDLQIDYTYNHYTGMDYEFNAHVSGATNFYIDYWVVDGDTMSGGNMFTHTFANPGNYNVCVYAHDNDVQDCEAYYCDNVNVYEISDTTCDIYADFSWYYNDSTQNVEFNANVSGAPNYDLYWEFGDGNAYAGSNYESHMYTPNATYYACLTATDMSDSTCQHIYCDSVYVGGGQPNCDLQIDYTFDHYTGMDYEFNAHVSGATNFYIDYWVVDGDTMSGGNMFTHTFANPGNYNVCVYAHDNDVQDCETYYCDNVNVYEISDTTCNIQCDFSFNVQDSGQVVFNGSVWDNNGDFFVTWDFDDGGTTYTGNINQTDYTHNFDKGNYHVCMEVVDEQNTNCRSTFCEWVELGMAECNINASFTYNQSQGLAYDFTAMADASPATNYLVDWVFDGDSVFNGSVNESHVFPASGTYEVCVHLVDEAVPCDKGYCEVITVQEDTVGCTLSCDYTFNINPNSKEVSLNGSVAGESGSGSQYNWTFGDGSSSINGSLNEVHQYTAYGDYEICFEAVDMADSTCSYQNCKQISIKPPCEIIVDYTYTNNSGNNYSFDATVTGATNVLFEWHIMGNGNEIIDSTYSHSYTYYFPDFGTYDVCVKAKDQDLSNCFDEVCKQIMVADTNSNCNIFVDFYHELNPNDMAHFIADVQNVSGAYHIEWTFDDNTGNFAQPNYVDTINHHFINSGNYYICATVIDHQDTTCKYTQCHDIFIEKCEIEANFNYHSLQGFEYGFDAVVHNATNVEFDWKFDNDTLFNADPNVNYIFQNQGWHLVCLHVRDLDMQSYCGNQFCDSIFIENNVDTCNIYADFVFTKITDYQFEFVNQSGGTITGYYWSFGDGNSDNYENPTHTYSADGFYTVCLTVLDDVKNCQREVCKDIEVGSNNNCFADFGYYIDSLNNRVELFNYSAGDITNYYWTFGDGMSSNSQDTVVVHQYFNAGSYEICLSVFDSITGCQNERCEIIHLEADFCMANFSFMVDNNTVHFNNQSQGNVTNFYWSFGDGSNGHNPNPNHLYLYEGSYEVCLTIMDSTTNCQSEKCKDVFIGTNVCNADFNFVVDSLTNEVHFTNQSTGKVTEYQWHFGDGHTAFQPNTSHQYLNSGVYDVCLTTFDTLTGCQSEKCKDVYIGADFCNAKFTFYVDSISNEVFFTNNSIGNVDEYYWTFGDGTSSQQINPVHQYTYSDIYWVCLTTMDSTTGCQSEKCKEVYIGTNLCNAKFTYYVDSLTNMVHFDDASTGAITNWYWTFGNGLSSNQSNPQHQYLHAGVYDVCLTAFDTVNNCQSEICKDVYIGADFCKAKFTFFVDSLTNDVFFTNNSIGHANSWFWTFGDGTTSNMRDPHHQFVYNGIYNVCLTTFDTVGNCQSEVCKDVFIGNDLCQANFSYYIDSLTNKVYFDEMTNGTASNWYWTFGNGLSSNQPNPQHQYLHSGVYEVCLSTYDTTLHCQAEKCKDIYIGADFCKAKFTYYVDSVTNNVFFTNNSVGAVNAYFWNFDNGATSVQSNPQMTYTTAGVYNVCLTTMDTVGNCQSEVCKDVFIGSDLCQAKFSYYVDSLSNTVYFDEMTTGGITDWFWKFGDGISSNDTNPSHQYLNAGVYNICLIAFNETTGCQSEKCKDVYIGADFCKAKFTYYVDSLTNNVFFDNQSMGNVQNTYWTFGDGTSSNMHSPSHQYIQGGIYDVCLTTYDPQTGCQSEICNDVYIGSDLCKSDFSYHLDVTTNTVMFGQQAKGNIHTYYWYFGDGTSSNNPNPQKQYSSAGVYSVCLTVKDTAADCQDYVCKDVEIGTDFCQAKFTYHVDSLSNLVTFNNHSLGNIQSYFWTFGDGTSSNTMEPNHTYTNSGVYTVCLTTFDPNTNCQSEKCKDIFIGTDLCKADFSFYIDSITNMVWFENQSIGQNMSSFWHFGDGFYSNLNSTDHQYVESGVYDVCLNIYDTITHCQSEICKDIYIGSDLCDIDFTYYIDSSTNWVYFDPITVGSMSDWYWTFGDASYHTDQYADHQYLESGIYTVCLHAYNSTADCQSSICKDIEIGSDLCKAKFTKFVNTVTNNVVFDDQSLGNPTKWYWDFGDGFTSTQINPNHTYMPGVYHVGLSITDTASGCYDYVEKQIQVSDPQCHAHFNYYVDPTNNSVSFEENAYGNIGEYYWHFGDNNFSTNPNPTNVYDIAGYYQVCLVVHDVTGTCMDEYCQDIQVGDINCSAYFTTYIDSVNNDVYFYDQVWGNTTNLFWEFGDGADTVGHNPVHHYDNSGFFKVSLNTYDSIAQCMDYFEKIILVGSMGSDCEASFIYTIDWATNTVQFFNESHGQNLEGYIWNFGDQAISTQENPSHQYTTGANYYNVCLTVFDSLNICRHTKCEVIQVGDPSTTACMARYNYSIDSNRVAFTDQSLGTVDTWTWDFGDSTYSALQDPTHSYTTPGYYITELYVQNSANGCVDKYVDLVNIGQGNNGLQAAFGYDVDSTGNAKSGYSVDFEGASCGEPAVLEWSFGDGGSDTTTMSPTHTYATVGTYTVCLTIFDPNIGSEDTYCKDIVVDETTTVEEITMSSTMGCYPNPASDQAMISYAVQTNTHVEIALFDVTGKQLTTFVSKEHVPGRYVIDIDVSQYQSGVYYLQMFTENERISKTIMIGR